MNIEFELGGDRVAIAVSPEWDDSNPVTKDIEAKISETIEGTFLGSQSVKVFHKTSPRFKRMTVFRAYFYGPLGIGIAETQVTDEFMEYGHNHVLFLSSSLIEAACLAKLENI